MELKADRIDIINYNWSDFESSLKLFFNIFVIKPYNHTLWPHFPCISIWDDHETCFPFQNT